MAIIYDKLFKLMESKGMKPHALRRMGIVGNATLDKLKQNKGYVDTRTINSICDFLQCQPGDIMEWVKNPSGEAAAPEAPAE